MRLSVGPKGWAWAAFWALCSVTLPLWIMLPLAVANIVQDFSLPSLVLLLFPLGICAFVVVFGITIYNRAFWLDGSVLVQRRVGRKRKCDLSGAEVWIEKISPNPAGTTAELPRLVARTPGGPTLRLWLRDPDRRRAMLPPRELLALADAISAGGDRGSQVNSVITFLRRMATDPLLGNVM